MLEIKVAFTFDDEMFVDRTFGDIEKFIRNHPQSFAMRATSIRVSSIEVMDEEVESDEK